MTAERKCCRVVRFAETGVAKLVRAKAEIGWVILGQLSAFSGGIFGIKVLTSVMGPEGYGQLALGMTIAGALNTFAYGPIGQAVLRFFSVYRERGELGVYFFLLKKAHAVLIFFFSLVICFAGVLTRILAGHEWALIAIFASIFGVISGINSSFLSLQAAVRQRKVVALHQGADFWLRPLLAVAAIYLLADRAYVALMGYILGTFFVTISQSVFAFRNSELKEHWNCAVPTREKVKSSFYELSAYVKPFVLWAGIAAVSSYADRWILQGLFGEREVGIYVAIYQIANAPIALVLGVINQLMIPIIYERAGAMASPAQAESSGRLLYRTIAIYGFVIFPIIVVAYFWSDPIIKVLTSSDFAIHHQVLWVVMLGISIFWIGQLLTITAECHNKPIVSFGPKLLHGVVFVLLAYLMARKLNLLGMGLALCGSSVLYVVSVVAVNRKLKNSILPTFA